MVIKLWGNCNSNYISFRENEAGRWEATVPASPTGTYIIELWAEDEAGNVGYFATIQVIYDPSKLCCRVEILDVGADFTLDDVLHVLQGDGISHEAKMDELCGALEPDQIRCEIVRCEVCKQ